MDKMLQPENALRLHRAKPHEDACNSSTMYHARHAYCSKEVPTLYLQLSDQSASALIHFSFVLNVC